MKDENWSQIVTVLHKIKGYQIDGVSFDELYYILPWDESLDKRHNDVIALQEIKALSYLESSGAIKLKIMPNHFMADQRRLRAMTDNPDATVYPDWDQFDGAKKYFEDLYYITRLDINRFETECTKFGLRDIGVKLVKSNGVTASTPPQLEFKNGDGRTSYLGNTHRFRPGSKAYSILDALSKPMGTPLETSDLMSYCNPRISTKNRLISSDRDVSDAIRYIKESLSVKTSEYFPLMKAKDRWIIKI